jgi:uncharacterized membrane protein
MADNALDVMRRKHAEQRQATEQRQQRVASRRAAAETQGADGGGERETFEAFNNAINDGGGFSLFGFMDFVLLVALLCVVWLFVKSKHNIDLFDMAWDKLKPNYDEGLFAEPDSDTFGDL